MVSNKEIRRDLTKTLIVFPNPATDAIVFGWEESVSRDVDFISVFDSDGRLLKKIEVTAGDKSKSVSLEDQPTGVYLAQLVSTGGYLLGVTTFVME